jgi:hypothetical protein
MEDIMKNYRAIGFILGIVMLLTFVNFGSFVFASDSARCRETLRGLKGVLVEIESIEPEIEQDGLTKAQIQTDVELKLRLAGIKVLSEEEWQKEKGRPFFYVCAHVRKYKVLSSYVFNIDIQLNQDVYLERYLNFKIGAPTWSVSCLGIISDLNDIRNVVKDKIDIFINAYLSVNPKK